MLTRISLAICSILLTLSLHVIAMDLQQAMSNLGSAKAQGKVGEQPDGYLGVVTESAEATEIAKLINDARRAEYQRLATSNNISVQDVEAMAGKKAIEKTQAGQYIQLNNKWTKKP
jgi:uncharacterized protein